MTVEAGDILKIVLEYVYPGAGTALNIFHYFYGGEAVEDTDIMDVIEAFFDVEWGGKWEDLAPSTAEIDNLQVVIVDNSGTTIRDLGFRLINHAGNIGADVTPAANSAYLQGNTIVPQVRGSKYVPALSENAITAGILNAGAVATLLLLLGDYLQDLVVTPGNVLRPGVLSSREGGFLGFETGGVFSDIPAYQRRRKVGVGI